MPRWDVCFSYDNDTAMGNDNEGGLTLKYGYMDTDSVGSKNVFNAADSSIWAMLRYCFADELQAMYVDRENAGAWNLDTFAALCDQNQDYACESLWIDDVWRKDINTFINVGTSAYIPMLNGKKRLQRRNFLHYQRPFISSYFLAPFALSDSATIRGYTPSSWEGVKPESKMTITPYSDLWVTVRAGSTNVQKRAKAGEAVELSLGNSAMNDTEIYVRCASFIADLGDLSCLYPGYIDISACGRLQKAVIGSSKAGYSNTNMTSATFKNAASLEYVNVENCPNLAQELDLSNNINVKEVYTRGSGITGVTFARFGRLKTALLNAVTSIFAADLNAVKTFTLEDYSALTTLNIVGSALDTLALVTDAPNISRVRLKDINWSTTIKAYKHYLYHSLARQIMRGVDNSPLGMIPGVRRILTPSLVRAFLFWERCSELSADRAAVLCDGGDQNTIDMLLKIHGYDEAIVNREEFLKHAMDLHDFVNDSNVNKVIEQMLIESETHPRLAISLLWLRKESRWLFRWEMRTDLSGSVNMKSPLMIFSPVRVEIRKPSRKLQSS